MRLCIVGPTYPQRGGIVHSNTLLVLNLQKKHDVLAVSFSRLFPKTFYPGWTDKARGDERPLIHPEYLIDSLNPMTWFRAWLRIRQFNPKIVYIQWWTTFLAPCSYTVAVLSKRFARTKVSIICQNVIPHRGGFLDVAIMKIFLNTAHFLVTYSDSDHTIAKAIFPKKTVRFLPEPSYLDVVAPMHTSRAEIKRRVGVTQKLALFFGLVREYKGLVYLIRAMPEVLRSVEIELYIVGEFWESREMYQEEIEKLSVGDRIHIVDRYVSDSDAVEFLCAADVVILPYTSNVESGVVQLAVGLGVPMILTTLVGNAMQIESQGCAIVVPPRDPEALAQAMIKYFSNNLYQNMHNAALEYSQTLKWDEKKESAFLDAERPQLPHSVTS